MALTADEVVEVLESATEENQIDPCRQMQMIKLPAEGEVWIAGDIHDNRRNFKKLVAAADLKNNPDRHLILQELIHGDHIDANGAEESWQILFRSAELKCDHPSQVHFLLANHDLAQIHGEGIMKAGMSVCEAFNAGVKRDFADRHSSVTVAITEYLLSFPLAARAPNGLFFCHSLPQDDQMKDFDFTVFDRPLNGPDYRRRGGSVYNLVWGRNTTPDGAAAFADKVDAKLLITGHQPQDSGYLVNGERHLIIASDHNQGVFLTASTSESYDMDAIESRLKKFVAVEA